MNNLLRYIDNLKGAISYGAGFGPHRDGTLNGVEEAQMEVLNSVGRYITNGLSNKYKEE